MRSVKLLKLKLKISYQVPRHRGQVRRAKNIDARARYSVLKDQERKKPSRKAMANLVQMVARRRKPAGRAIG